MLKGRLNNNVKIRIMSRSQMEIRGPIYFLFQQKINIKICFCWDPMFQRRFCPQISFTFFFTSYKKWTFFKYKMPLFLWNLRGSSLTPLYIKADIYFHRSLKAWKIHSNKSKSLILVVTFYMFGVLFSDQIVRLRNFQSTLRKKPENGRFGL